jgi:putative N6-adenine-specific DNA methylase
MFEVYAVCGPGLEPFVKQELDLIGLSARHTPGETGGVEFQGSLKDLYRVNLRLRTASRVWIRVGAFYAAAFPELRRKASHLVWEHYVTAGHPVALRVTCHKSRLYHQGAVGERVAGAVADRLGRPSPVHKWDEGADEIPPQLIGVRLVRDHCVISVDSSGALLHRRGYRLAATRAPLRETLAAAMLMASGWDQGSPLLDPFCGSGTIPIEAALLARNIPPGIRRRFAFMDWPNYDAPLWKALAAEGEKERKWTSPRIIASDRDAGAIEAARANAERAGVLESIEFSCRAVSSVEPPSGSGWVVTNPPYGMRVGREKDLRDLYATFGKKVSEKCRGWGVTLLSNSSQLLRSTGLDFDETRSLTNGGIRVRLAIKPCSAPDLGV